jgi:hypothetical protein
MNRRAGTIANHDTAHAVLIIKTSSTEAPTAKIKTNQATGQHDNGVGPPRWTFSVGRSP